VQRKRIRRCCALERNADNKKPTKRADGIRDKDTHAGPSLPSSLLLTVHFELVDDAFPARHSPRHHQHRFLYIHSVTRTCQMTLGQTALSSRSSRTRMRTRRSKSRERRRRQSRRSLRCDLRGRCNIQLRVSSVRLCLSFDALPFRICGELTFLWIVYSFIRTEQMRDGSIDLDPEYQRGMHIILYGPFDDIRESHSRFASYYRHRVDPTQATSLD
jgi:hypothetical protein